MRPPVQLAPSVALVFMLVVAGCGQSATKQAIPVPAPAQTATPAPAPPAPAQPAPAPAQTAATASAAKEQTIEITMKDFSFTPDKLNVPVGTRVKLVFKNEGEKRHDFKVEAGLGEPKTEAISSGGTATLEFVADKAGDYVFFCTLRGHRDRGMHGVLAVK